MKWNGILRVATILCALLLASCQQKSAQPASQRKPENEAKAVHNDVIRPIPAFVEKSLLGATLGPDGAVTDESETFNEGQPIYLTLRLHDSPVGLQTGATWYDNTGTKIAVERRPMNGAKLATFAMTTKLRPGHYRVEGYWGGNLAANKTFEVVARPKK